MGAPDWNLRRPTALDDAPIGGLADLLIYQRLGWERVGVIPGYALMPEGGLCSTTVFYRNLDIPLR